MINPPAHTCTLLRFKNDSPSHGYIIQIVNIDQYGNKRLTNGIKLDFAVKAKVIHLQVNILHSKM